MRDDGKDTAAFRLDLKGSRHGGGIGGKGRRGKSEGEGKWNVEEVS